MRSLIRRFIPSMFNRRLMLLVLAIVTITMGLGLRLAQLTTVQGAKWRSEAEKSLFTWQVIPSKRGRILDRHLRVLAEDRPSYDLAVRFPVINGAWALQQAEGTARRRHHHIWRKLDRAERLQLITDHLQPYERQVEQLWTTLSQIGDIEPAELASRLQTIKRRVQRMVSAVQLARLRRWSFDSDEPVDRAQITQPIGEQAAPHSVLIDLSDHARLNVDRLMAQPRSRGMDYNEVWSQVSVVRSKKRHYPLDTISLQIDHNTLPAELRAQRIQTITAEGVGIHLLGSLRGSWKEERANPFNRENNLKGYLPGDLAGEWGLERACEAHLRGTRGRVIKRLDDGITRRVEPVGGQDVICTIDIYLQSRVKALMDPSLGLMRVQPWHTSKSSPMVGLPLRGAAVVLDVAQGHVLAAVSTPSFTRNAWRENRKSIEQDLIKRPFWNRAVYMPYQPGSTIKPMVLAAAMTEGKLTNRSTIDCNGHLLEDHKDRFRCWYYKLFGATHRQLNGAEAIERSCNIFFYSLGERMGAKSLVRWYERFGLGRLPRCGLFEEAAGDLPNLVHAERGNHSGFSIQDSILMGIGQGPIRWTPIQAASAYATLARGGYMLGATFIMAPASAQRISPLHDELDLHPDSVPMVMQGLYRAANNTQPGTGTASTLTTHNREPIFNIPDVAVFAKSGTATTATSWVDRNGNGEADYGEHWVDYNRNNRLDREEIVPSTDNAWCIAMVQSSNSGHPRPRHARSRPEFIIAVVAEHGGSGGLVAGPIVNQILHALRAEGYL